MHIFVLNLENMVNNIIILYLRDDFKRNFSKKINFKIKQHKKWSTFFSELK